MKLIYLMLIIIFIIILTSIIGLLIYSNSTYVNTLPSTMITPFNSKELLNPNPNVKTIRNHSTKQSNICIFMVGTENIMSYYKYSLQINKHYANKHNYDFIAYIGRYLNEKTYAPHFERYYIAKQLFDEGYEYVLYVDCDAYIQQQQTPLYKFINMMKNSYLLVSNDLKKIFLYRTLNINSGVLLMKNNQQMKQYINIMLHNPYYCHTKGCFCGRITYFKDQCIAEKHSKFLKKGIKILPLNILQSINVKNKNKRKNSFILHFAGGESNKQKLIHSTKHFIKHFIKCS